MAGNVGRPRKQSPRRSGATAREEILDASAELFTTNGFGQTSTHQIADAVGIRQASLYYHFPSKAEIFLTLLKSTVEPSLRLAEHLDASAAEPSEKLWALVAAEARLLLSTRWNVGRLYQLPVANSEEFADYHRARRKLEGYFHKLAVEVVGPDDPRTELPFHIALTAVEMRANDGTVPAPIVDDALPSTAVMLADAVLNVLQAPLPKQRTEMMLALVQGTDPSAPVELGA
ncbi:TetR/AcrR family transcriptional regulator [Corynebacterium guangdongense]|uniref:AcrR family transcriptional regulator n=1 Tax=Corynebacterium guangdongense TaxID=1783348 RepID=A0ABU1ZVE4_9CORY|nr:TetR/AcrR family transcriptional regulator [Corynebacterium guangdongense]MDR7328825.1 AcrR family transcriptional regulator [Corynebacterium guangdongense]WJZ17400.1 HTH-type transcriptional repressor KstR2 [Corynebacterium guangdongense]